MSVSNSTARGHDRGHRIALGVALPIALVAASVTLVPAALASTGNVSAGHGRSAAAHLDRARTWTADALRAAAAAPADSTVAAEASRGAGRAVAPRVGSAITGPALLFSQVTLTGSTIGKVDFSTAVTTTVTKSPPVCVTLPRLSPDGNTIVAVTFSGTDCNSGTTTVATFDAGTGTLLKTLDTAADATTVSFDAPNWSHDGSTILYTKWGDRPQMYTVPATGGTPTALGGVGLLDGAYSPDGSMIVAANDTGSDLNVWTSTGTLITHFTAFKFAQSLAWSPDGSKISFSYDKAQGGGHNYGIGVVNADGTGLHALPVTTSDLNTTVFSSSWSDDGTQIFYDAFGHNPATGAPTVAPAIYATDVAGVYRATIKASSHGTAFVDPFFVLSSAPAIPVASTYTAIAPVRVLAQTPLGAGATRDVQITGVHGIPAGATAVTVNLTGVAATATTFLTAYPAPAGTAFPVVSNLNLVRGQTAAIAVQVTVSGTGSIRIRNSTGTTGVIVDVSGYFQAGTAGAGYVPLTAPVRRLDQKLGAGASQTVNVSGVTGAPTNAVAVVLNLTGALPNIGTWQSVVPSPLLAKPTVSNLNLPKGTTRANLVTAKIGAGGNVVVYNAAGSVRTIVDVVGFYTTDPSGMAYYPLNPLRILDTRDGTHTPLGSAAPLGPGGKIDLATYGTIATAAGITRVPSWATAVAFNLTGVAPTVGTFLSTVATPGTTTTSSVNLAKGGVVPNLVISSVGTATGSAGMVRIKNSAGAIAVLADLAGFYGPLPI